MESKRAPKDFIIFPLDVPDMADAKDHVESLSGAVGLFKVGLELYTEAGPEIIDFIHAKSDAGIFLDLKLHDIPTTVKRAVERIADMGIQLTTVHCGESDRMLKAAVEGARNRVSILGVTLLTSVTGEDIRRSGYKEEWVQDIAGLVEKRAQLARDAGCDGVVCSALEVERIKRRFGPGFVAVTPGIRPNWEGIEKGDQRRILSPAQAVANGSDYLVIGRPIRDAADPLEAARRIAEEIEAAVVPAFR